MPVHIVLLKNDALLSGKPRVVLLRCWRGEDQHVSLVATHSSGENAPLHSTHARTLGAGTPRAVAVESNIPSAKIVLEDENQVRLGSGAGAESRRCEERKRCYEHQEEHARHLQAQAAEVVSERAQGKNRAQFCTVFSFSFFFLAGDSLCTSSLVYVALAAPESLGSWPRKISFSSSNSRMRRCASLASASARCHRCRISLTA